MKKHSWTMGSQWGLASDVSSGGKSAKKPPRKALQKGAISKGPFQFEAIGWVRSPYHDKFGIPRQPGLVPSATAVIELLPSFELERAVQGLEACSHLWVLFVFHRGQKEQWTPTIRPPRLGGKERVGVLSTRSPHRPNPIGMSNVVLDRIEYTEDHRTRLWVSGVDLLDGTPVLDVKPYLPYCDAVPEATVAWAQEPPQSIVPVQFSPEALQVIEGEYSPWFHSFDHWKQFLTETLALDPRPAFQKKEAAQSLDYTFRVYEFDVSARFEGSTGFLVYKIVRIG